ncbi:hypothetical protein ACFVJH_39765 [Streptomyces decoyicus]|uniref:hypothetical protein n=1 Tax=Streptomyces decoyicus TaxID=249567 RepID=UPI003627B322
MPEPDRRRSLLLRIKTHIQQNFPDPYRAPPAVAAAHPTSGRYLHRLFPHEERTVVAWIHHQRRGHAAHNLTDPTRPSTPPPIHAIAARWDFPCHADFPRAFHGAYSMPPRLTGPRAATPPAYRTPVLALGRTATAETRQPMCPGTAGAQTVRHGCLGLGRDSLEKPPGPAGRRGGQPGAVEKQ